MQLSIRHLAQNITITTMYVWANVYYISGLYTLEELNAQLRFAIYECMNRMRNKPHQYLLASEPRSMQLARSEWPLHPDPSVQQLCNTLAPGRRWPVPDQQPQNQHPDRCCVAGRERMYTAMWAANGVRECAVVWALRNVSIRWKWSSSHFLPSYGT